MYLFFNATGARRRLDGERIRSVHDHFRPSSELFPKGWAFRVLLSTVGCIATVAGLVYAGTIFGGTKVRYPPGRSGDRQPPGLMNGGT